MAMELSRHWRRIIDMTDKEIILDLLKRKKLTEVQLKDMVGYKHQSDIWKRLHKSKSIKVCVFLKMLDALGMECVVRPKGKYRTKYKLTGGEEE